MSGFVIAPASTAQASVHRRGRPSAYLFWVLLLLPMDWFAPTGMVLREFGAKPATLLLTLGGLYALLFLRGNSSAMARRENRAILLLALISVVNLCAFSISIFLGWSDFTYMRSPTSQFINQSMLILAASLAIVGNARYFSQINLEASIRRRLPQVATIHLLFWVFENAFPSISGQVLFPFRVGGLQLERSSGFMTEPSYYGTMAALFGIPMLLAPQFRGQWYAKLIALGLLISAVSVSSKTLVVVVLAQALLLIIIAKRGRLVSFLTLILAGGLALFFIQTHAALNLKENMSSVMRFGSAHLAVNVATTGVALTGIGAGQFHFHYIEGNAPYYLLASSEALAQMSRSADGRASTFNFPLRVLIELGVFGFILFLLGFLALMRGLNETTRVQQMLLFGSLGFLLTQDTYFYPPLVLSCAMLLAHERRFTGVGTDNPFNRSRT